MTIKGLASAATLPRVTSASSAATPTSSTAAATVHLDDVFETAPSSVKTSAKALAPSFKQLAKDRIDLRDPNRSYFVETDYCDPAMRPGHDMSAKYKDTPGGELYGAGGPTLDDVKQGATGDCWFMSSLGSLVSSDPQRVRDMVRDNQDGTFSVRLYAEQPKGSGNFVEDWETVDDDLPRWNGNNDEVYAKARDSDHDGHEELWAAVVEKAMVQHMQKHFPEQGSGYQALNDDMMSRAMEALTGNRATVVMTQSTNANDMWAQLNRVNEGDLVSAATPREGKLMPGLWQPHCYTVTGVVEVNGQRFVDLRNPAGTGEPFDGGGPSDGVFRLTYDDFRANFSEVAAAD